MNLNYSGIQSLEGLGQMLGALTRLQELTLQLRGCKGLTVTVGLEATLKYLKKFDISFRYTAIRNMTEMATGISGMEQLQHLV
eukprot:6811292-Heterocapsa_arctica.AAC.1